MTGYSIDLRERVVAAVDKWMGKKDVAETFGVSVPTINPYLRHLHPRLGIVNLSDKAVRLAPLEP